MKYQIFHFNDRDALFIWGLKDVIGLNVNVNYDFDVQLVHTNEKIVNFLFNVHVSNEERRQISFSVDYEKNYKTIQAMISGCDIFLIDTDFPGYDCNFDNIEDILNKSFGIVIKLPPLTIKELSAFKEIFESEDKLPN